MHADLSRITFRPEAHYSAVLAQQGRVQLDADANEQAAIQLYQARVTATDLIGQHGGPAADAGFRIDMTGGSRELDDLSISPGRYYVDGILVEAYRPQPGVPVPDPAEADAKDSHADAAEEPAEPPATWTYWDQPDAYRDPERPEDRLPTRFPYLAYLKVWERSVTAAEDPALREVALGAALPDTAARLKVVWQVLPLPGGELDIEGDESKKGPVREAFGKWVAEQRKATARIAVRSERPDHADDDPCLVKPDARYRGPENQLYRIEIHDGGAAKDATFKWSRENGSVTFPVDGLDGTWVELATLGNDDKLDLDVGDWVEFVDSAVASRLEAQPLLRVEELDLPGRRVRLSDEPAQHVGRRPELHPYLRRWDQREGGRADERRTKKGAAGRLKDGAVRVEEGTWLPLEDGVEVYFQAGGTYRSGDFWLVPARTATGSVEWPADAARRPLLQTPLGPQVHYAPLGWVMGEKTVSDLRLTFKPLAGEVAAASDEELAAEEEARAADAAAEAENEPADVASAGPAHGAALRSQTTAEAESLAEEG
ncbi:hypothetical protein C3486_14395 [Streptomyces sp. Ru73]|uniref:DUF6519 domain-containing protein n=1 Tax=Streptomyces sp. Ru73 TaxID=2080748 RepID=UPI000CDD05F0|nr:DUF6519 domain-containing protein [Streptomyces sp. Ru73]POX40269.1 hypothetical protein C3486_14395 [Streptomyces sp. Ru73]